VDSLSPFHTVPDAEWIASNATGFSIWDLFPVNPGHALVVPHRVAGRWWDLTPHEQAGLLELVARTRAVIDDLHQPAGYNVGFNDGATAGQTVSQLHIHVIPRYPKDVPDPRGGVRHVIPARGNYLLNPATP
jgi:diadenosine tetraphosphate (Ap4A) HIT family hydrolase